MRYVLVEKKSLRLEKGDVLHADSLYYLIGKVDKMRYVEEITLAVGAVDVATSITNMTPLKHEVYYWEELGLDGLGEFMVQYPLGNPIMTPKGLRVLIDQLEAPRLQPMRVDRHILPATFPVLLGTNRWLAEVSTDAWFYGWKYEKCKVISAVEAEAMRIAGKRVLEVEA